MLRIQINPAVVLAKKFNLEKVPLLLNFAKSQNLQKEITYLKKITKMPVQGFEPASWVKESQVC